MSFWAKPTPCSLVLILQCCNNQHHVIASAKPSPSSVNNVQWMRQSLSLSPVQHSKRLNNKSWTTEHNIQGELSHVPEMYSKQCISFCPIRILGRTWESEKSIGSKNGKTRLDPNLFHKIVCQQLPTKVNTLKKHYTYRLFLNILFLKKWCAQLNQESSVYYCFQCARKIRVMWEPSHVNK